MQAFFLLLCVLLKHRLEGVHAGVVNSRHRNSVLFRLLIHGVHHFVGTCIREHHHQVWRSQLRCKIRRHLCEHLCLAAVAFAYVLVSGRHAVVAAYYYYAHLVSFLKLVLTNHMPHYM